MGHFAQIKEGKVCQVIVIGNDILGENLLAFPETEPVGRAFIANTLGLDGEWRQTSYNASFRYNYAGIGFTFDLSKGQHGAFIPQQPYPSWTLDENCRWVPPVQRPADNKSYVWDENAQEWQVVETE